MFKKISHIILALLIVITTMGMTVSKHFCGDTLRDSSLFTTAESCCDIPDCCHNESETYVIEDSYSISTFNSELTLLATFVPSIFEVFNESLHKDNDHQSWLDVPPPPNIQVFLSKHQSFLL